MEKTEVKKIYNRPKPIQYEEVVETKYVYVSKDGKEFDTEMSCVNHELELDELERIREKYNYIKTEQLITDTEDGCGRTCTIQLMESVEYFSLCRDLEKLDDYFSPTADVIYNDIEKYNRDIILEPNIYRLITRRYDGGDYPDSYYLTIQSKDYLIVKLNETINIVNNWY